MFLEWETSAVGFKLTGIKVQTHLNWRNGPLVKLEANICQNRSVLYTQEVGFSCSQLEIKQQMPSAVGILTGKVNYCSLEFIIQDGCCAYKI